MSQKGTRTRKVFKIIIEKLSASETPLVETNKRSTSDVRKEEIPPHWSELERDFKPNIIKDVKLENFSKDQKK